MQNSSCSIWKKEAKGTRRIDVLLFPQFSNHCLANAIEPVRAANTITNRDLYKWRFLSPDGASVTSSSGLTVETEKYDSSTGEADYFLVVSSYNHRQFAKGPALPLLHRAAQNSNVIVGLDTGAWLMAAANLMDGRRATIHADILESFAETYLDIDVMSERFVIDGKRITCGGAMAAFDLMMELISQHHGQALRMEVTALFLHDATSQRTTSQEVSSNTNLSTTVQQALKLMDTHIENPLSLRDIAQRSGCSPKSLQRKFINSVGTVPSAVYKRKRLAVVRQMASQTDLKIAEIALRCGYENPAAMTRAFKSEYGYLPKDLRN